MNNSEATAARIRTLEAVVARVRVAKDGRDGRDGVGGTSGIDGARGERGPQGPQGQRGEPGPEGPQGVAGPAGRDGANGVNGQNGRDGKDGFQGMRGERGPQGIPGTAGPEGQRGPAGADGYAGQPGEDGTTPRHEWQGSRIRFEEAPGVWGKWTDLRGPRGASGSSGKQVAVFSGDSGFRPDFIFGGDASSGSLATPTLPAPLNLAERGFVGPVTRKNFGINWVRRWINYNATFGTAAGYRSDDGAVSIFPGTESAGHARIFFGFDGNGAASGLFEPGTTTLIQNRLDDLDFMLDSYLALGIEVMMVLDGPLTPDPSAMLLFGQRLQTVPAVTLRKIAAIEPENEPYERLRQIYGDANVVSQGIPKCCELIRVTHAAVGPLSADTKICTPPFQGGEVWAPEALLKGSAAGIVFAGSDGVGFRGEHFIDWLTYHPYGVATTLALAAKNYTRPYSESTIRQYSSWIKTAVPNRRAATDGGAEFWAGRPDPLYVASEFNVNFVGSNVHDNRDFRYQALSPEQRARCLEACVIGAFAVGYDLLYEYAPDHSGDGGPFVVSSFATGSSGDLRIVGGAAVAVLDGDVVTVRFGNLPQPLTGVAYEATDNGLNYTIRGVPASARPSEASFKRSLLGGWHAEWAALQARFTGYLEAGFVASADIDYPLEPLVRLNGGTPFTSTQIAA